MHDNNQALEDTISDLIRQMSVADATSKEYAYMADQLVKLYSLRETPKRISKDTLAIVGGNLLGILIVVGYERMNAMTSRAMNLLLRTQPK